MNTHFIPHNAEVTRETLRANQMIEETDDYWPYSEDERVSRFSPNFRFTMVVIAASVAAVMTALWLLDR